MLPSPFDLAALLLLLAAPSTVHASNVLVVDASGSPGTYTSIQTACDAALDGDTVLVKAGTYPAFALVDRSLSVAAEAGSFVLVNGAIRVRNLGPDKTVSLVGIHGYGRFSTLANDVHGLVATSNHGPVRLVNCELGGASFDLSHAMHNGSDGILVVDCVDVSFTACTLYGGAGAYGDVTSVPPGRGGIGMVVTNSSITLYDGEVLGGPGGSGLDLNMPDGGNGNTALQATGSTVFSSRTTITGGPGGNGLTTQCFPCVGGNGGDGVVIAGGTVRFLGVVTQGGNGGQPNGCGFPGGPPGTPGTARIATAGGVFIDLPVQPRWTTYAPNPVRENATLALTSSGVAGDRVAVVIAPSTASVFAPQWNGQQMSMSAYRLLRLTTLTTGFPQLSNLAMAELGPGIASKTYFFQTLFRAASGEFVLGSPAPVVVLDAAY